MLKEATSANVGYAAETLAVEKEFVSDSSLAVNGLLEYESDPLNKAGVSDEIITDIASLTAFSIEWDKPFIFSRQSNMVAEQISKVAASEPVPEPSTYLLFGSGIIALYGMARRTTRKKR